MEKFKKVILVNPEVFNDIHNIGPYIVNVLSTDKRVTDDKLLLELDYLSNKVSQQSIIDSIRSTNMYNRLLTVVIDTRIQKSGNTLIEPFDTSLVGELVKVSNSAGRILRLLNSLNIYSNEEVKKTSPLEKLCMLDIKRRYTDADSKESVLIQDCIFIRNDTEFISLLLLLSSDNIIENSKLNDIVIKRHLMLTLDRVKLEQDGPSVNIVNELMVYLTK